MLAWLMNNFIDPDRKIGVIKIIQIQFYRLLQFLANQINRNSLNNVHDDLLNVLYDLFLVVTSNDVLVILTLSENVLDV